MLCYSIVLQLCYNRATLLCYNRATTVLLYCACAGITDVHLEEDVCGELDAGVPQHPGLVHVRGDDVVGDVPGPGTTRREFKHDRR